MLGNVGDKSDNGSESVSTSSSELTLFTVWALFDSLGANRGGSDGESGGGNAPEDV